MQCGLTLGAYVLPLLIFNSWTFDIYVLASIEMLYISVKMHYRSVETYQDTNYETKNRTYCVTDVNKTPSKPREFQTYTREFTPVNIVKGTY